MNNSELNQNELKTKGNIKLKNIHLNNQLRNEKELPLINQENIQKYMNTLSPRTNDKNLLNFYKIIHSNNKPLDNFPINCENKRFIILNLETNLNDKNNEENLLSISAIEMINAELTGIQFQAYFNNENNKYNVNIKNNNKNNLFSYLLSNYFFEREDNNKKLFQKLLAFIGKSMIICHNALYTIRFINKELKKYNLSEIPIHQCLCTLRIMRMKNYRNSEDKIKGLEIFDLFKYYNINIDKNNLNNSLITLILSICVTKMLQEEIKKGDNNYYKNENDNNIGIEKNYDTEQKDDFFKSDFFEINNNSERLIKESNIFKIKNNSIKNNLLKLPNNNIFTNIQNNKKEFDKKYKIAKSFNKYKKFICDKSDNSNILNVLNENSHKKNNFLMDNFSNKNSLIKKNIYNKININENTIKIGNIN